MKDTIPSIAEIFLKVNEIICYQMEYKGRFNNQTKLYEDIGMDSLDITEAILTIEKEFNIHITDDSDIETVSDLIYLIDFEVNNP